MLEIFQEKNNQQQLQKGLASCAREMPFLTNNTVSSDVKTVILKICFKRIKRYLLISELKNIEKCKYKYLAAMRKFEADLAPRNVLQKLCCVSVTRVVSDAMTISYFSGHADQFCTLKIGDFTC